MPKQELSDRASGRRGQQTPPFRLQPTSYAGHAIFAELAGLVACGIGLTSLVAGGFALASRVS
jgi:hypothetical protein